MPVSSTSERVADQDRAATLTVQHHHALLHEDRVGMVRIQIVRGREIDPFLRRQVETVLVLPAAIAPGLEHVDPVRLAAQHETIHILADVGVQHRQAHGRADAVAAEAQVAQPVLAVQPQHQRHVGAGTTRGIEHRPRRHIAIRHAQRLHGHAEQAVDLVAVAAPAARQDLVGDVLGRQRHAQPGLHVQVFERHGVQLAPHQFGHGGQVGVGRAGVADTVEVAGQGEIICVHGGEFLQRVA